MNESEIYVVKDYKFVNPLITKIDYKIDKCYRDCHSKYFHTFEYRCVYNNKFTNIGNNEIINLPVSDKSMNLYEFNEKLKNARQRGFIFNQIIKLTIKFYSHSRYINISYYLKLRIPMCHRLFSKISSQKPEYIQTHCNDRNNHFHFARQNWISQFN